VRTGNFEALILGLKVDEGFRAHPYDDATGRRVKAPTGQITVGYGTNLDAGITATEAEVLLRMRACAAVDGAEYLLGEAFATFSGPRQVAFANLVYNMGVGTFSRFKRAIAAAQAGSWWLCADELERSKWYTQVGQRAVRIVAMIREG